MPLILRQGGHVFGSLSKYVGLADCWLVGGDFNVIKASSDRVGGTTIAV